MEKIHLVAVLPNGYEYFEDVNQTGHTGLDSFNALKQVGMKAVRKAGLTTSRKDPVAIPVVFFRMEIKEGKLDRWKFKTIPITPDFERMTLSEYDQEMGELLNDIPQEFHSYVYSQSYEQGHSSGYEEQLNVANNIVENLSPCIKKYCNRINN